MTVTSYVFSGHVVEEELELSLGELSQACDVNAEWLMLLVDEGILELHEGERQCCFGGVSVKRVRTVQRLQRDLGVNLAGAALTLELLEEMSALRARLVALEHGSK
ncbi:MAG: MerR family transcriptional regulator [Gammaproteobacteria bacterium]|nr:MerR family transcriptional regulator [Gammaproteobacteria bacterium]